MRLFDFWRALNQRQRVTNGQAHEKTTERRKWNNKTVSFTFVLIVPRSLAFSLEFAFNQIANAEKIARSRIMEERLQ
ncbi:hypothetical protein ACSV5N_20620 [Agrobacterium salinitolerans]|uniref:hypothetical protein n=1 Tax=Agrobacterium salinitolerans TaxID=1183413 RepID=UPI003FD19B4C